MGNRHYHAEEKRGTKKRKVLRRGQIPRKAMIAAKNSRRAFKTKYEQLMKDC